MKTNLHILPAMLALFLSLSYLFTACGTSDEEEIINNVLGEVSDTNTSSTDTTTTVTLHGAYEKSFFAGTWKHVQEYSTSTYTYYINLASGEDGDTITRLNIIQDLWGQTGAYYVYRYYMTDWAYEYVCEDNVETHYIKAEWNKAEESANNCRSFSIFSHSITTVSGTTSYDAQSGTFGSKITKISSESITWNMGDNAIDIVPFFWENSPTYTWEKITGHDITDYTQYKQQ